jgi:hypothetical protein
MWQTIKTVSILPIISKIYDMVLSDQLVEILIIFFMIVYVLQKGPCMSDHTTETP